MNLWSWNSLLGAHVYIFRHNEVTQLLTLRWSDFPNSPTTPYNEVTHLSHHPSKKSPNSPTTYNEVIQLSHTTPLTMKSPNSPSNSPHLTIKSPNSPTTPNNLRSYLPSASITTPPASRTMRSPAAMSQMWMPYEKWASSSPDATIHMCRAALPSERILKRWKLILKLRWREHNFISLAMWKEKLEQNVLHSDSTILLNEDLITK